MEKIKLGCVYYTEEPMQIFCECGEPLQIYRIPYGHVALPIKWIKKGCNKCKKKLVISNQRKKKIFKKTHDALNQYF